MTKPKSKQNKEPQAPATADASADSDKAAKLSEHIGRELRSMFDGVVAEPVPDRFRELLEALEKKQAKD
jgi:Anti-sigma factor NepR